MYEFKSDFEMLSRLSLEQPAPSQSPDIQRNYFDMKHIP
jgi:hypothetical protein